MDRILFHENRVVGKGFGISSGFGHQSYGVNTLSGCQQTADIGLDGELAGLIENSVASDNGISGNVVINGSWRRRWQRPVRLC